MIEQALKEIEKEMQLAEIKYSRPLGSVSLMAVSKLHTYENILEAYRCGQRLFGENHVQEIATKFPLDRPVGMMVHLIGHLQTNKVKRIVPLVDSIDSVDSLKLLDKIQKECQQIGKVMPILLEFNTSEEEAKSGFLSQKELFDTIKASFEMKNIKIGGLMTVGPLGGDEAKTSAAFKELRMLSLECKRRFPSLGFSILSMGMSQDFPLAIGNGSTVVRIGTRIFGERNYNA